MTSLASVERQENSCEEFETVKVSTPGMVFNDVMFEQVDNGTFVVYDRREQKFQVTNEAWHTYERNGIEYFPLSRLPWPVAHIPKLYESEEQLYNEIRDFFVAHLDVANELLFDVYTSFVMASWRPEDFTVAPYLFFLGPLASGKTRALECFHRLCYRSIMAASMSAASLFRALEAWHPTLLLDETEIYRRESMIEVLALLNTGYRKGQYTIRIEKIEEGVPQVAMFDTFGFKVLAGTEELAATLQSRCIVTTMSKAVREINLFIDEEKAEYLRNKLLMYRFQNLGKKLNGSMLQRLKVDNNLRNARVVELFISLLQVSPSEEVKQRLFACMKRISQSRFDEEQASIEARVFDAILKCEDNVEFGKVSTRSITEAFNEGLSEKEQVSSRFIGRKVAALGFEKCKLSRGGLAGFYWNRDLIERLRKRYCPTLSRTTLFSPLTPHSPETMNKQSSSQILKNGESGENRENGVNPEDMPPPSMKPFVKLEDLKTVHCADGFYDWHPCAVCGYTKLTSWKGETFKGEQVWICEDCKLEWEKKRGE